MSLKKAYGTDKAKETEGVRHDFPQNDDGTTPYFIVARAGRSNKRYVKALDRIMTPHAAAQRTKTLGEAKAAELLMQAFVEGALMSWGNIALSDVTGVDSDVGYAEFSFENATKLFTNLPDLLEDLQQRASDITFYRSAEQDANAGN